jgi:hypothetical protein
VIDSSSFPHSSARTQWRTMCNPNKVIKQRP